MNIINEQQPNGWGWTLRSHDVRPAATVGEIITSGAVNTKGSWTEVLPASYWSGYHGDAYEIVIAFNTGFTSATVREKLCDVGISPLNDGSYTVIIPDLIACGAGSGIEPGEGYAYRFRLRIPNGCAIAVRSQDTVASSTVRAIVKLFGAPSRPDKIGYGSRVVAFGVDSVKSRGTAIVTGTTVEGDWYSIATLTQRVIEFQMGLSINDSTFSGLTYSLDMAIGDATNKLLAIDGQMFGSNSAEAISRPANVLSMRGGDNGDILYVRSQCSTGTTDTGISVAVYGVI